MTIKEIKRILLEYNKSGQKMTTLSAPGGEKASGKNYDNIIVGASQPYKITNNDTQYMKMFPVLGRLVKSIKEDEMGGEKIIIAPQALKELSDLNKISRFKKDENGKFILPFGDGVRLENKNGNFFLSYEKKENGIENITDNSLTDIS